LYTKVLGLWWQESREDEELRPAEKAGAIPRLMRCRSARAARELSSALLSQSAEKKFLLCDKNSATYLIKIILR
jgi:hypothetical protein